MNEISAVAGFVFANGDIAHEIVFHPDRFEVLTDEENAAIGCARGHLNATRKAVLSACRESLWSRALGHPLCNTLHVGKNNAGTMLKHSRYEMSLDNKSSVTAGTSLRVWDGEYCLTAWCWTQAKHRDAAAIAAESVRLAGNVLVQAGDTYFVVLPPPKGGEVLTKIGERVADKLWPMIQAFASEVLGISNE